MNTPLYKIGINFLKEKFHREKHKALGVQKKIIKARELNQKINDFINLKKIENE